MKLTSGNFTFEWLPFTNNEPPEGNIPNGYDLVITEASSPVESAMILYGFDEWGLYDADFENPVYGWMSN